jgi:hypothetical protein
MKISKEKMLEYVIELASHAKVKTAIGGGVAVCAHGYRRDTSDVDAFFHRSDRQKVLRAIHESDDSFVLDQIDPSHYILVPEGNNADERIDLMFTAGDPEESAIVMSKIKKYHGYSIPVFPIDLLIAAKLMANREDPKDALDIYALWKRGAYDIEDVQKRLQQMGFSEDAENLPKLITYLENIPRKKK